MDTSTTIAEIGVGADPPYGPPDDVRSNVLSRNHRYSDED